MKAKLSWSGWLAGAAMLAALTLTAPPRASAQDIHVRMSASGMPEFMFGGEPRLTLVPNTTVYYVSDFDDADIYRVSGTWYGLYHGTWYRSDNSAGPWSRIEYTSIPRDVVYLPAGYRHFEHLAAGETPGAPGPDITISTEPRMVVIPGASGTRVYYARDFSNGDLYRVGTTWYLYRDSRWYSSTAYSGPWNTMTSGQVPVYVVRVPSAYAHYPRVSTTVSDMEGERTPPDYNFTTEPQMVLVPGTDAYYARDFRNGDVYRANGKWYTFYNGYWYRSDSYGGPWSYTTVQTVPREVVNVPTGYYHYRHSEGISTSNHTYTSSTTKVAYHRHRHHSKTKVTTKTHRYRMRKA